jgi:ubiquinone/menaquinone biosynthesis C-methylase UbiE
MDSSKTREVYNHDVIANGGYLYTGKSVYSACVATQKQTDEIHRLIRKFFKPPLRILDMGCGDGTYTLQMLQAIRPKEIVGFDIAEEAIAIATERIPKGAKNISFTAGDAYRMSKKYKQGQFDLGVFRGVLHHMEQPQKAIAEVAKIMDWVLVLEPNGFNPVLKVIEKISPYHKNHGEKSYWPPTLDRWFTDAGYRVASKKYFSIVPYFCPKILVHLLKLVEPVLERIPLLNRFYCGGILVLYRKK